MPIEVCISHQLITHQLIRREALQIKPRSFALFQISKTRVRQTELLIDGGIAHVGDVLWSNASRQFELPPILVIHLIDGLCLLQSLERFAIETRSLVAPGGT